MDDDPVLGAKRTAVERAIQDYTQYRAAQVTDQKDAYVLGWVAFAEYTSVEFQKEEVTGNMVIVKDDQTGGTSRGLYSFGVDSFTRAMN